MYVVRSNIILDKTGSGKRSLKLLFMRVYFLITINDSFVTASHKDIYYIRLIIMCQNIKFFSRDLSKIGFRKNKMILAHEID